MKKTKYVTILHSVVLAVALIALLIASFGRWQSVSVQPEQVRFQGQYSIDAAEFQTLTESTYLNANRGDLILRGNFVRENGEMGLRAGENLNFYQNHIGVVIYVNGELLCDADTKYAVATDIDADDLCGAVWHSTNLASDIDPEDVVEIHLTNIHTFGNRDAYWELLNQMYLAPEAVFEEYQLKQAMSDWIAVGALAVFAIVLLGTALGFAIMRNPISGQMASFGLLCLFMGGYILFDTQMFTLTSDHLIFGNVGYHVCMMLSAFELCQIMLEYISGTKRKAAATAILVLGVTDVIVALASLSSPLNFYDTAMLWSPVQMAASLMLVVIGVCELIRFGLKNKQMLIAIMILQLTLLWELANAVMGWLDSGIIIKPAFLVLFAIYLLNGTKRVISNQIRAVEAERLEEQLTESRIATMISQIQPHFIYNTLGTIGHLCLEQPEKASELVHNFSMYLRGNFTELDNLNTIRLANEIEHVRCYTEIEKIRFPDMTVLFDIQSEEFSLPPLTVQPLVENAIKHGLMGLETGGTVKISSYETKKHYCVLVEDDGVGFDTSVLQDPHKHIGIRNIRGRLEAMCDGTLSVKSSPGVGTTATIKIPKERRNRR